MKRWIIRARSIATEGRPLEDKLVIITGRRIEAILPSSASNRFSNKDFISQKRYLVSPGVVDMHVHGGGGARTDSLGGLLAAAYYHAAHGTQGMLVSIFFTGLPDLRKMADLIKEARHQAPLHLLGLHLEGPVINPEARGAIPKDTIHVLKKSDSDAILQMAQGELKMITIAPEMPGAELVIKAFSQAGVLVSLGHSHATGEEVKRAIEWGAKMVTHLGNAMKPFHQREPGLIGAALSDSRLIPEIIADGQHLANDTLSMFLRAKQGKAVLVSDCRWVGGLPEGSYEQEDGNKLIIADGVAKHENGTVAGSIKPLWDCVRHVASLPTFNFWEVLPMATRLPAKLLGKRTLGRIIVGGRADLVLAGPDFSVKRVIFGGEEIYHSQGESDWELT